MSELPKPGEPQTVGDLLAWIVREESDAVRAANRAVDCGYRERAEAALAYDRTQILMKGLCHLLRILERQGSAEVRA